jgi:hypothetical protein
MINWIKNNKNVVIRNTFLLPILLVVIMSISHVVSWYDLGNPISWAVYLSIAIEIFALSSVAAATIKINRASIWFLFGLVTFIQIVGNIFFEYKDIDITSADFLAWVDLIYPFFEDWNATDHRRLLAIVQGGTLPLMSLTALHYYIKFTDLESDLDEPKAEEVEEIVEDVRNSGEKYDHAEFREALNIWGQTKGSMDGISDEDIMDNYRSFLKQRDKNLIKASKKPEIKPKRSDEWIASEKINKKTNL